MESARKFTAVVEVTEQRRITFTAEAGEAPWEAALLLAIQQVADAEGEITHLRVAEIVPVDG